MDLVESTKLVNWAWPSEYARKGRSVIPGYASTGTRNAGAHPLAWYECPQHCTREEDPVGTRKTGTRRSARGVLRHRREPGARAREERPVLSTSKGPHTVQAKTTEPLHCFPNAGRTIKSCQYEGLASKLMHQNRNDAQNCCIAPSFGKRWDNVDGYLYKCGVSLLGTSRLASLQLVPPSIYTRSCAPARLWPCTPASATTRMYLSFSDKIIPRQNCFETAKQKTKNARPSAAA